MIDKIVLNFTKMVQMVFFDFDRIKITKVKSNMKKINMIKTIKLYRIKKKGSL